MITFLAFKRLQNRKIQIEGLFHALTPCNLYSDLFGPDRSPQLRLVKSFPRLIRPSYTGGDHACSISMTAVMPNMCGARCMLHCGRHVWVTQTLVQSVDRSLDPIISSAIAVFEQIWCVDWQQTATVNTKETIGCPQCDLGVSDTLILPYTHTLSLSLSLSLSLACQQASSALHAAAVGHTLDWVQV